VFPKPLLRRPWPSNRGLGNPATLCRSARPQGNLLNSSGCRLRVSLPVVPVQVDEFQQQNPKKPLGVCLHQCRLGSARTTLARHADPTGLPTDAPSPGWFPSRNVPTNRAVAVFPLVNIGCDACRFFLRRQSCVPRLKSPIDTDGSAEPARPPQKYTMICWCRHSTGRSQEGAHAGVRVRKLW